MHQRGCASGAVLQNPLTADLITANNMFYASKMKTLLFADVAFSCLALHNDFSVPTRALWLMDVRR